MPILALLHIAIAIYFAVHAVRTGRNTIWLFALLMFPLLGSVVYFFAEYLPEKRNSRVMRNTGAALKTLIDPNRELREAQAALEQTPSMGNRLRLAQALLAAGRATDALPHFQACAQGQFAKDAEALTGLARTQRTLGQAEAALATLDMLFADQPARQTGELALLYAELSGEAAAPDKAEQAFAVALARHGGIATNSAWGAWLAAQGRAAQARPVLEQVAKDARLSSSHARAQNAAAIERAALALKTLSAGG